MKRRGDLEGTIYQRADGRWEAKATVGYGVRRSFYGTTRQEVVQKLREAQQALESGLPLGDGRQTTTQFLESWLRAVEHRLRQSTWNRYCELVALHIVPALGQVRLAKLSPQHVQQFYAQKLASDLSPTTVRHMHATLHRALGYAVKQGLVPRNVTDAVEAPRMRHAEMQVLSAVQARAFLAASWSERLHALFVLALATGMRQGELLALRWQDVDLVRRTLNVRASLRYQLGKGFKFEEPKTKHGRRTIALAPELVAVLQLHRTNQDQERAALGPIWRNQDLVFASEVGGPIEATNLIRGSFARVLRTSGVPRVRFHDLRHSCATLLLAERVNPKVVSELLGHSSVAITLDIYAHVLPDMQQDAVTAIQGVLFPDSELSSNLSSNSASEADEEGDDVAEV
jgi:integrase